MKPEDSIIDEAVEEIMIVVREVASAEGSGGECSIENPREEIKAIINNLFWSL